MSREIGGAYVVSSDLIRRIVVKAVKSVSFLEDWDSREWDIARPFVPEDEYLSDSESSLTSTQTALGRFVRERDAFDRNARRRDSHPELYYPSSILLRSDAVLFELRRDASFSFTVHPRKRKTRSIAHRSRRHENSSSIFAKRKRKHVEKQEHRSKGILVESPRPSSGIVVELLHDVVGRLVSANKVALLRPNFRTRRRISNDRTFSYSFPNNDTPDYFLRTKK